MDRKYISAEEFRSEGYLQEVNRRFLHPLGLAMEVWEDGTIEAMRKDIQKFFDEVPDGPDHIDVAMALLARYGVQPGRARVGGVWDYRDDPEGMSFAVAPEHEHGADPIEFARNAMHVTEMWVARSKERIAALGYMTQPAFRETGE